MFRDGEAADKASLIGVACFAFLGVCHAWRLLDFRGVEVDPSYLGVSESPEPRNGNFAAGNSMSDNTGVLVRVVKVESSEYSLYCRRDSLTAAAF